MKLISFNINSIRARFHQLQAIIDKHEPDVIGLQETKVSDEDFPLEQVSKLGYHIEFHGQKGHYGVALMSKQKPLALEKGFPNDEEEAQRRVIIGTYASGGQEFKVFNGYFPQGENRAHETKFPAKEKFYQDLNQYVMQHNQDDVPMLIMGDFNISHHDNDIGIGEKNAKRWLQTGKCSFLPEEREWLNKVFEQKMFDTFRLHFPEVNDRFSWFDYRSKGFADDPKRGLRIDLILAPESLKSKCVDAGIDYDIRGMEKPSDHCPIWATFES